MNTATSVKDPWGIRTPLRAAAICDNPEVLKVLLAKIDVTARDERGRTALMQTTEIRPLEYGAEIREVRNLAETARIVIQRGGDVNARDREGKTALLLAVEYQNVEVVRALLEAHADATPADNQGQTVSTLIQKNHNRQIYDLVRSANPGLFGQGFLEAAASTPGTPAEKVQAALQAGADIDRKSVV